MNDRSDSVQMPIKATPYKHQRAAFSFACRLFGLLKEKRSQEGGDDKCQKAKLLAEV